jgi:tRNA-dihydrouridine synthase B
MISCKTVIHQPAQAQHRYLSKDPAEGPVCFQLSGTDTFELAEAVKRVTAAGADLIDLNCGCPVKKIRSRGAGSKLLTNPLALYQLITTMKQNTHVPVSIKIRVEGGDEKFNQQVADAVTDAGADFLIVHGRHWTEHYETPCRHDEIAFFVDAMSIPVIGNGDVASLATLKTMLDTGCAGVMVGRAGVGQPWLIGQLMAEYQNQPFILPDAAEVVAMLLEHVERLIILLGSEKFAILQARKFAKYYARMLPNRAEFHAAVNQCDDLTSLREICQDFFVCVAKN